MQEDCPFCVLDRSRTVVITEGSFNRVFFSNPRLMPGHLLVVPKRHVEKLGDLNEEELRELWALVIEYQERLLCGVARGCDLRINFRPFQSQSRLKVHHLHVHLQPRKLYDDLFQRAQVGETSLFKDLPPEEAAEITRLLSTVEV